MLLMAAVVVIAVIIVAVIVSAPGENLHKVRKGNFTLAIEVKGEIQGKNAIVISLPDELAHRDLPVRQFKIKEMVEEGTVVQPGDWVATLDAAEISQQIERNSQDLERVTAELNDAKIDSSITLTSLRKELSEFVFDLEYKEIELEQAQFESPAYQRRKRVEYDQTVRMIEKKHRDYELRRLGQRRRISWITKRHNVFFRRDSLLKIALNAVEVTAPKEGTVMYARLWNGRKLRTGDNVSMWMPTIATLPDLSTPVSEAYIPEIDITKISPGDSAEITIDALPKDKFKGVVSEIANIGQELAGFDMKVFRITIDFKTDGKEIKPSMTSNNKIIVSKYPDVVKIPRNFLQKQGGESYVYLKESGKTWRKRVTPGLENEEEVIIESGLSPGDRIFASPPQKVESGML